MFSEACFVIKIFYIYSDKLLWPLGNVYVKGMCLTFWGSLERSKKKFFNTDSIEENTDYL
jgi:hypothetical protein